MILVNQHLLVEVELEASITPTQHKQTRKQQTSKQSGHNSSALLNSSIIFLRLSHIVPHSPWFPQRLGELQGCGSVQRHPRGGARHSHLQMAGRSLLIPPSLDPHILEIVSPLQGLRKEDRACALLLHLLHLTVMFRLSTSWTHWSNHTFPYSYYTTLPPLQRVIRWLNESLLGPPSPHLQFEHTWCADCIPTYRKLP